MSGGASPPVAPAFPPSSHPPVPLFIKKSISKEHKATITCHCWAAVENVLTSGQEIVNDCDGACHGIGWNDQMPATEFLKCLLNKSGGFHEMI